MTAAVMVREARPADCDTIVDFNLRLAAETENKELPREVLQAGVQAALADANKARYFMAMIGDEVAGQLMLTREWSDWRNGDIWWIQSVYVVEKFRQAGVFRALYQHVEQLAKATTGVVGLRLYVEDHNLRAQQVYERLGMKRAGYQVLETIW